MLYLIKTDIYYKIGISNDPEKRMKELFTGCPTPMELVAKFEMGNKDFVYEQGFHKMFSRKNTSGEWFALSDMDVQAIFDEIGKFQRGVCRFPAGLLIGQVDVNRFRRNEAVKFAANTHEYKNANSKWMMDKGMKPKAHDDSWLATSRKLMIEKFDISQDEINKSKNINRESIKIKRKKRRSEKKSRKIHA